MSMLKNMENPRLCIGRCTGSGKKTLATLSLVNKGNGILKLKLQGGWQKYLERGA